jgi:hypothetical protein
MNHRTYGETRNCAGCRHWSEMIARSHGGPVEAMCLSQVSQYKGHWVRADRSCAGWESGHFGAVDEPGQDPDAYKVQHLPSDDTEGGEA